MARLVGHLSPELAKQARIYWVKKFGGECPHCGASIKELDSKSRMTYFTVGSAKSITLYEAL
jgi:formamidopyrimidine-DNA glycosylase